MHDFKISFDLIIFYSVQSCSAYY